MTNSNIMCASVYQNTCIADKTKNTEYMTFKLLYKQNRLGIYLYFKLTATLNRLNLYPL